jgi:2-haloacid dehalogenase
MLEELAAAGVNLYLLSNMPVSTFDFLIKRDKFFAHFKQLVISGAIRLLKPEPAIYKHLVEKTGIVPAESVFIDDLLRNVIAARESGLHAIQFRDPASCRAELRAYLPGIGL